MKFSVLVVRNLSLPVKMFAVSNSAECLDEFDVWSKVSIEEIYKCSVAVTFPRWSKEFDRMIKDHGGHRAESSLLPRSRERRQRYSDSLKVEWTFVPNNQTYRKINKTTKEPSIMQLR